MYATIEPRLIALLPASEPFVPYQRPDLPPLDKTILKSSARQSLPEPRANSSSVKRSALSANQNVPYKGETGERTTGGLMEGGVTSQSSSTSSRMLGGTSSQSLRKILEDVEDVPQTQPSKKRPRTVNGKDEYFQLPQPVKKQKAKQVVPPIIIGLFEPPPNQAALFPPIASSSFHDSHGRNSLNTGPAKLSDNLVPPESESTNTGKGDNKTNTDQNQVRRTRRKWTEEETAQLLLGVQAHGVGNWTKILNDPEYTFNCRKAVDLKDRFRTCCPTEMQGANKNVSKALETVRDRVSVITQEQKSPRSAEIISIDSDDSSSDERPISAARKGPRKGRAHRKKLEDLAQLGICEPFKRSGRRERRPFSEEEDRAILQGFQEYGTAWTQILKDPRFNLQGRRSRDLRDRLRNKYPERYNVDDGQENVLREFSGSAHQTSIAPMSSQPLPPSSAQMDEATTSKTSLNVSKAGNIFKDNFLELLEPPPLGDVSDPFDWGFNLAPFPNVGEMDLSRILLDDTWNPKKIG